MLNYTRLPLDFRKPMHDWIMHGLVPANPLLAAVIHGDMKGAINAHEHGDMVDVIQWLRTEAPPSCWGSKDDVEYWKGKGMDVVGSPIECDNCSKLTVVTMPHPISLGAFMTQLKKLNQNSRVVVDVGGNPGDFSSWRGDYSQLALQPAGKNDDEMTHVDELVNRCNECIGKSFDGYKGGAYTMAEGTELHFAEWGECGRDIAGVVQRGSVAVIITAGEE